jgi:hypothetical protein
MSDERNEHFKNFAKLLWQDLLEANGYGYIDVNVDDDPTDPTNYQQLIAQHAYDLVQHTIDALWPYLNEKAIEPSATDIPDLIEWPTTAD